MSGPRSLLDRFETWGADESAGSFRDVGEADETVGESLSGGASFELFLADRLPELVDDLGGIVSYLIEWKLEML